MATRSKPSHPSPPTQPLHSLLCGAVNAAVRLALSLCATRKGGESKPRPAPRIRIHASAVTSLCATPVSAAAEEVLVLRQIRFRNEFRAARRERDSLSG